MQAIVDSYLAGTQVSQGSYYRGMTLFPLRRKGESPLTYRVLSEALADGSVEVRERPSATVPELWLINRSDAMVLVMDGEEIVGGKQNRMVNASFLIAPHSEVALPVTCVEHGRWHDVAPRFSSGEAAPAFLRRAKEMQVRQHLRADARPMADQGAVWAAIAEKHRDEGTHSPTGALHDIYLQKGASLAEFERAFPAVEGAVGMAVALNGQMMGADLFDQPATAAKLWPKLVRSYAMDAPPEPQEKPVSEERAGRLLRRLVGARVEVYPSIALGQDLRLEGDRATGSALVYEAVVVHMSIFRVHGRRAQAEAGGIARASTRGRLWRHRDEGPVY